MSDTRSIRAPKVMEIKATQVFSQFDSLMLIDIGGSGFSLQDSLGNITPIPTGIPITIGAEAGMASGPITILAPLSGSLDVAAIYYS